MGRRRNKGRNISGVLLLDKPMGLTSNQALQEVKHLFKASKAGHTGSLDPLATGLLPICFGEATKLSAFLLDADKHYRVRVKLGETTTTADAEGELLETNDPSGVSEEDVRALLDEFHGEQQQLPPMYSAIKHKGERLYKLARQGLEVEREPRTIHIHALRLLGFELYLPTEFAVGVTLGSSAIGPYAADDRKSDVCGSVRELFPFVRTSIR